MEIRFRVDEKREDVYGVEVQLTRVIEVAVPPMKDEATGEEYEGFISYEADKSKGTMSLALSKSEAKTFRVGSVYSFEGTKVELADEVTTA